jgi:hypothetical protein
MQDKINIIIAKSAFMRPKVKYVWVNKKRNKDILKN